jgi:hypothetical protein
MPPLFCNRMFLSIYFFKFMYFAYVIVLTCRKALAKDEDGESLVEILCPHLGFLGLC